MPPETVTPEAMMELIQTNMNIVWIAVCAALVFFMQAGFAMLESGMVRSKNSINVIMKNYTDMCFGAIVFWAVGYGLMFGTSENGWYGTDGFFLSDGYSVGVFGADVSDDVCGDCSDHRFGSIGRTHSVQCLCCCRDGDHRSHLSCLRFMVLE